jgi:dihydropteridine reductase
MKFFFKENTNANENILVDVNKNLVDQEAYLVEQMNPLCQDNKLDAIFNVAGGWAGGNAATAQFLSNSNLMWNQSVCSSLITASLGKKSFSIFNIISLLIIYLKKHANI